jgi:hypothetical protein
MSTPTYDGKGQPIAATGWFSGFTAWWQSLTPQYVTRASRGIASKASYHLDKPRDSSEIAPTASEAGPPAPSPSNP